MTWDKYGITIIFGEYNFDLSYVSIFIFFAVLIILALFYYLFTIFFGPQKDQKCKWKRIPESHTQALIKWRCKTCLVEAYSTDKRPPKECKKTLKAVL